ncbi:MAG: penicillin-binding protein 2, partial [Acidimicrobiales bacterium]
MTTSPRIRLAAVGVVVLSLFAAMFTRLWYLQVLDSENFVQAADANQVRIIYEEAPRGRILDRSGKVIVGNRRSPTVTVERDAVEKAPEVKARLAALLGLQLDALQRRIDDVRFSPFRPIPVAQDVTDDIVVYIAEHATELPGVKAEVLAQRNYPQGALGAHLLGYVGEINDTELETRKDEGYRLGDSIGKSGIERVFETDLRGQAGITKLQVDARGRVQGPPLGRQEPVQGHDVQLTIDIDIQRAAEDSLLLAREAALTRT